MNSNGKHDRRKTVHKKNVLLTDIEGNAQIECFAWGKVKRWNNTQLNLHWVLSSIRFFDTEINSWINYIEFTTTLFHWRNVFRWNCLEILEHGLCVKNIIGWIFSEKLFCQWLSSLFIVFDLRMNQPLFLLQVLNRHFSVSGRIYKDFILKLFLSSET